MEGSFGTCVEECQHDINCTGEGQKCCSNGCGHVCVNAVPGKYLYNLHGKQECALSRMVQSFRYRLILSEIRQLREYSATGSLS